MRRQWSATVHLHHQIVRTTSLTILPRKAGEAIICGWVMLCSRVPQWPPIFARLKNSTLPKKTGPIMWIGWNTFSQLMASQIKEWSQSSWQTIGPAAYKLLWNLVAPAKLEEKSFKDLVDTMRGGIRALHLQKLCKGTVSIVPNGTVKPPILQNQQWEWYTPPGAAGQWWDGTSEVGWTPRRG